MPTTSRPSSPTTPPKPPTPPTHMHAHPPPPSPKRRPQTSYLAALTRWLQLKKYQYEVTFSLYMLTPTERLIFNFIILLLFVLLVTAASMYLPNHVALIYNRIWYYVHGNGSDVVEGLKPALTRTAAAERVLRSAVGEL